jgi:hypothetical protein
MMMELCIKFKEIVDSVSSTISRPKEGRDLERLYEEYSLPSTSSLSTQTISDHLFSQVGACIRGTKLSWKKLKKLESHLILKFILDNDPLFPYLTVLEIIIDSNRNSGMDFLPIENCAEWRNAIQCALNYIELNPTFFTHESQGLKMTYTKLFTISDSTKFLRLRGFQAEVREGEINIEQDEAIRIFQGIENCIRTIGGLHVANQCFIHLANPKVYDENQERYHYVRQPNSNPSQVDAMVPFQYILHICAKNPETPKIVTHSVRNTWREIIELSTSAMSTIYNIQPYSIWEDMFISPPELMATLGKIVLFDNLFSLYQLRPSDTVKMLEGLFSWVEDNTFSEGLTIEHLLKTAQAIIDRAPKNHGLYIFSTNEIVNLFTEIDRPQIKRALDIFSHGEKEINQGYLLPHEITKVNYIFKPLIKTGKNFVLINRSWCAPAFYEAIAAKLRDILGANHVNNKIGTSTELFLRQELHRKNVEVRSGKYKSNQIEGECDLIVETSKAIVFIELKKKALTRAAKSGDDAHLLMDISKSLLDSQIQMGNHELNLRRNGFLDLENNGNIYRLNLHQKEVSRVSLTLHDHGSLQDRDLVFQILENFLFSNYRAVRPQDKDEFDKLAEKFKIFRNQYSELEKLRGRKSKTPFSHCWFLSVPQLLILLDDVNSGDDFHNCLTKTKFISTRTYDFYSIYAYVRHLYDFSKKSV